MKKELYADQPVVIIQKLNKEDKMNVCRASNCFYRIVLLMCFLVVPLSFHARAEEASKTDGGQQEQASEQNQPRISFDSTSYDAGEVWEGDEVIHTFTVTNTGGAQLDISRVRTG